MILPLYGFWFLLNGAFTWEIAILGAVFTALFLLLMHALFGYTLRKEWAIARTAFFVLAWVPLILLEILKACFTVMKIILNKAVPVHPVLVELETELTSDFGRFLFANSITLTPGTITVRVEGGRYIVHCLSREMLDGVKDGAVYRMLKKMEA